MESKKCPRCGYLCSLWAVFCQRKGCVYLFLSDGPNSKPPEFAPIHRTYPAGTIPDATGYSGRGNS